MSKSERDTLIDEKLRCDANLAKLSSEHSECRRMAARDGKYTDPVKFANMEANIRSLKFKSQQLQAQLSGTKGKRENGINDYFRNAASKVLDEKQLFVILELAHDLMRKDQQ